MILGWQSYTQRGAIAQQQALLHELGAKLEAGGTVDRFASQEKCANRAEQVSKGEFSPSIGYVSHYNERLRRGFMLTSTSSAGVSVYGRSVDPAFLETHLLFDAFEGKEYGRYMKGAAEGPADCAVTLPSGDRRSCRSLEEFDTLAKN